MMFVTFSSLYSFEGDSVSRFNIPHADKIVHFIFYFMASILGLLFIKERSRGNVSLVKALLYIVIATVAYGILIEILQYSMTTSRTGDIWDGLANTAGSLGGAILMKFYFSKKNWSK